MYSQMGGNRIEYFLHVFTVTQQIRVCIKQIPFKTRVSFLGLSCHVKYCISLISRCPVRCPDWSCSQPTCSKYHGESYDNLYFFQIDATFFCRSLKVLTSNLFLQGKKSFCKDLFTSQHSKFSPVPPGGCTADI